MVIINAVPQDSWTGRARYKASELRERAVHTRPPAPLVGVPAGDPLPPWGAWDGGTDKKWDAEKHPMALRTCCASSPG